ncbi:MAG: hypothetical protein E5299_01748 [Burkholderia gladioli]|nr:MAG: hypothetical protein E5299_01748 [Burkholderia gladioli]
MASTGIISGDTNGFRTSEVCNLFHFVLALDLCNNPCGRRRLVGELGRKGRHSLVNVSTWMLWPTWQQRLRALKTFLVHAQSRDRR